MKMSDYYAERDGIKKTVETIRKYNKFDFEVEIYHVPCEKCGTILKRRVYNGDKTHFCDYCRKVFNKKANILKNQMIDKVFRAITPKEIQFSRAIEEIEGQVENFRKYDKAAEMCRKKLELFGSIPEVMVAIELVRLGYKVIPQQKISKYRVDFLLPNEKLVVEVDGEKYHSSTHRHSDREAVIQLSLGFEWKILHVPAELIRRDIKKVKDIINKFK